MKKVYTLLLCLSVIVTLTHAQQTFVKRIPLTSGQCVTATKDGGYLVTGARNIIKYSASDKAIWTLQTGDSIHTEFVKAILTKDNGFLIIANTLRPNQSLFTPELCKLDAQGKIIWQKALLFGYSAADVVQDAAGNYVFAYNNLGNVFSSRLIKLDVNGNTIWTRALSTPSSDSYISSIKLTQDNHYAIAGLVNQNANFSVFDSSGNQIVNKTFNYATGIRAVVDEFANGDFLFVTSENDYSTKSAFINRLTKTGDIVWQKVINASKSLEIFNTAIISGNTISLAGHKVSRSSLADTMFIGAAMHEGGKLLTQQTIKLPTPATAVSATRLKNGSYIILAARFTYHLSANKYNESYIIKVSPSGEACNATDAPATGRNNNIAPISASSYAPFTLNTIAPALSFAKSSNLSETLLCDFGADTITDVIQKTSSGITNISSAFGANVYPNPVVNQLAVKITVDKPAIVQTELIDMFGKTILRNTYSLSTGISIKKMNVGSLARGTYLLKVISNNEVKTSKVVKQ